MDNCATASAWPRYTGGMIEDHRATLCDPAPEMSFGSPADAARYYYLTTQIAHHYHVIEEMEREQQAIMRRARWSIHDIIAREG